MNRLRHRREFLFEQHLKFPFVIPPQRVVDCAAKLIDLLAEHDLELKRLRLADTVGWGAPDAVSIPRIRSCIRSGPS